MAQVITRRNSTNEKDEIEWSRIEKKSTTIVTYGD